MKISDERLSEIEYDSLINHGSQYDDYTHTEVHFMATELQQHREEKRWRKIEDEGLPTEDGRYQVGNKHGLLYDLHIDDYARSDKAFWMSHRATHWRPLPMDLPEGE